jgi:hypothetical protein
MTLEDEAVERLTQPSDWLDFEKVLEGHRAFISVD